MAISALALRHLWYNVYSRFSMTTQPHTRSSAHTMTTHNYVAIALSAALALTYSTAGFAKPHPTKAHTAHRHAAKSTAMKECTDQEWQQADNRLKQLKNWSSVEAYYAHYKQCDYGYIAEGSTDAISVLMTEQWASLPQLNSGIKKQGAGYKPFVLSHISEIIGQDRLQKLQSLSTHSCPRDLKALCADINKAASAANAAYVK